MTLCWGKECCCTATPTNQSRANMHFSNTLGWSFEMIHICKNPRGGGGRVSLSGPWTIYIVGDFNINLLLAETSRYAQDFLLSLQSFSFIPGAGPGGPAPPIFRPSWGLKGRKKGFWRPDPPYLRIWMTAPPPWSEGLDPPLQLLINQHTVCHLNRQWFG